MMWFTFHRGVRTSISKLLLYSRREMVVMGVLGLDMVIMVNLGHTIF